MNKHLSVALCIFFNLTAFANNISPVQNGVLDLRNHNWQTDGIINVSGNWDFYWNKFYDPDSLKNNSSVKTHSYAFVPDFWNKYITTTDDNHTGFGFATYHV